MCVLMDPLSFICKPNIPKGQITNLKLNWTWATVADHLHNSQADIFQAARKLSTNFDVGSAESRHVRVADQQIRWYHCGRKVVKS